MGPHRSHTSLMIWVVNSHIQRQVASTILTTISELLHRLTPARSLSRGLGRAQSYHKVCTRRSLEQSHRDAPSCAHLRATWCMKNASQITTKVSKTHTKTCMLKHTRSTHALYEQQVPLQFSTKYTFY